MFILDMKAPGVEIRAINQIDGGRHFNEIFFTDVRIPKSWQIGPLNDGWRLATAMLMYERVAIGTGSKSGITTPTYKYLAKEASERGKTADPLVRQDLMRLYSEETTRSLVAMRTRDELKAGKTPGPGGSLGKLHAGADRPHVALDLGLEITGPEGIAWTAGGRRHRASTPRACCAASRPTSPAAPTRSRRTSSATACSACPGTSPSTSRSRSRT